MAICSLKYEIVALFYRCVGMLACDIKSALIQLYTICITISREHSRSPYITMIVNIVCYPSSAISSFRPIIILQLSRSFPICYVQYDNLVDVRFSILRTAYPQHKRLYEPSRGAGRGCIQSPRHLIPLQLTPFEVDTSNLALPGEFCLCEGAIRVSCAADGLGEFIKFVEISKVSLSQSTGVAEACFRVED